MASGLESNRKKSAKWRGHKRLDGFKRYIIWASPELQGYVSHYAFREMVPEAVAIEMILKRHFKEGDYGTRSLIQES
jgi:hypothetical protein